MKPLAILAVSIVVLSSCSMRKESSNITGRTDEVYFTVNDTRKPDVEPLRTSQEYNGNLQDQQTNSSVTNNNYTGTYSNRLRYFGSTNSYCYSYSPTIVPSIYANYYSGWNVGLTFVNPRYGYISGFNSPFSPYYGLNMPYYDPFYANSWTSGMWMTSYYPRYYFNPYYYNPCYYSYGYNSYYYPYYNPYYSNFYNNNSSSSNGNATSVRRTGSSNNIPSSNTSTTQPQNSSQNNNSNQNNSDGRWYSNGNNDRGGYSGGSGGSSGGSGGGSSNNSDRGASGAGGSTRRR